MHKCKRIIDGKTYNTETATFISEKEKDNEYDQYGYYLYQTRFGVFFLHTSLRSTYQANYDEIEPLSHEEAQKWLEENRADEVEIIERLFGVQPEAGSDEIKYTLRMAESLRNNLALRAKANNQSLNAWIIRCLEACATNSLIATKTAR